MDVDADTTHHDDDGTDKHDAANHDNDCTMGDDGANNHDDGASGANHDDVTNHDDDDTNHDDVTNHDDDGTNHDDVTNHDHDNDGTNHDDVTNHDDGGDWTKLDRPFIYTGVDSEDVWFEWIPSLLVYIKRFRRVWMEKATLWALEDLTVEGGISGQRQCNSLKQDWVWSNLALMNNIAGAQQPRRSGWGRR
jgi:hypothetical protein